MYINFNRPNGIGFAYSGVCKIFDAVGDEVPVEATGLDLETGMIEVVQYSGGKVMFNESRETPATVAMFRTPPLCLKDSAGVITTAGSAPPDAVMEFVSPRSGQWRTVRDDHLSRFGSCAACASRKPLNVHHIVPFHVEPARELDPSNLLTLCETPGRSCHLLFGHLLNWSSYNPDVKAHAALILRSILDRPGRVKTDQPSIF